MTIECVITTKAKLIAFVRFEQSKKVGNKCVFNKYIFSKEFKAKTFTKDCSINVNFQWVKYHFISKCFL